MPGPSRRGALLVALLVALLAAPAARAVPPPLGGLRLVPNGCIAAQATAGCTTDVGAADVRGLAVNPNGSVLYLLQGSSGAASGALLAYRIDPASGHVLGRLSCFDYPQDIAGCTESPLLYFPGALAIAPDGHGVYVSGKADGNGSLVAFGTDPSGALTGPTSCFSVTATLGCGGAPSLGAHALVQPVGLAAAPDGAAVYTVAASNKGGLAAFARDRTTGALTAELACVPAYSVQQGGEGGPGKCGLVPDAAVRSATAVAATAKAVYAASDQNTNGSGSVVAWARDSAAGTLTSRLNCFSETAVTGCGVRSGLIQPYALAASPSGGTLWAAGDDLSAQLNGQLTTIPLAADGSLTGPAGCVGTAGIDGCTNAFGVRNVIAMAASVDGRQLYVPDSVDAKSGSLSAFGLASNSAPTLPAIDCFTPSATATCAAAPGLERPDAIAATPDGRFVYVGTGAMPGTSYGAVQAYARELPPACQATSATTTAAVAVAVPLRCSDPNGDTVTLQVASPPANGSLGAVDQGAATVTYTPNAGFVGNDAFTYSASDGRLAAPAVTAAVKVDPKPPPTQPSSPSTPSTPAGPKRPSTCTVPRVIGMSLKRAKQKLAAAHCALGKVKQPKRRRGTLVVVAQSPASGRAATSVTLTLGKPRKRHARHR